MESKQSGEVLLLLLLYTRLKAVFNYYEDQHTRDHLA